MNYQTHKSSQRTASSLNAIHRDCILKFTREILILRLENTLIVTLDHPSMSEHNHHTIRSISRLYLENSNNKDFIISKDRSVHTWAILAIIKLFCVNRQKLTHPRYYNIWSHFGKNMAFLSLWQLFSNVKTMTVSPPFFCLLLSLCVTHMHAQYVFSQTNSNSLTILSQASQALRIS